MFTRYLLVLFIFCAAQLLSAQDHLPANKTAVFFATASAKLNDQARAAIEQIATEIQNTGDYHLQLSAHTDSRGTNIYNQQLAQDRLQAVANYLLTLGITTDGMQTRAMGEQLAGNDQNDEERQQQNRRVDIMLESWQFSSLTSIQDSLRQPLIQQFSFDNNEAYLLEGAKGGRFLFPANSFETADGQAITGPVEVKLTECYSLSDMISLGLTTTAQDRILESGGMFEITASVQGEPLQLREGVSIAAMVPTPQFQENMSLFYGESHGDENSDLDWQDTRQAVQTSLPRTPLAQAPFRPHWEMFANLFMSVSDEEVDSEKPTPPSDFRPRKPREPDYDKIVFRPYGLQKVFLTKNQIQKRTEEQRLTARQRYERNVHRYEVRKPRYDSLWQSYEQRLQEFEIEKALLADENGWYRPGSDQYYRQKALADEAFQEALAKYQLDSTRYEAYRSFKAEQYEAQAERLGSVDKNTMEQYFFNINRLGWANIDRFMKGDLATTPLAAKENNGKTDAEAMVFVLFPERNIILRMNYLEGTGFQLARLPIGEKAKIVAVKVKQQQAFLASSDIIIEDDMVLDLDYKKGRLRDIRAALDAI
jgi:hypothetical protein